MTGIGLFRDSNRSPNCLSMASTSVRLPFGFADKDQESNPSSESPVVANGIRIEYNFASCRFQTGSSDSINTYCTQGVDFVDHQASSSLPLFSSRAELVPPRRSSHY